MRCKTMFAFVMALVVLSYTNGFSADLNLLKAGVVKIKASPLEGSGKVGTGFIVEKKYNIVVIITATHVVEGDPNPQVAFYPKANVFHKAKVLALEGGERHGLAVLQVEGLDTADVQVLGVDFTTQVQGGESISIIGFPRATGTPWMIAEGALSGWKGTKLTFAAPVEEGSSGGPLILDDRVVGIVTQTDKDFAYAIPMVTAYLALQGWGVKVTVETPGSLASRIMAKDGAPMVLVPEGEFFMGSQKQIGDDDERPQRKIYLDAFYIDQYEVTFAQFKKFWLATHKKKDPQWWDRLDLGEHGQKPVFGYRLGVAEDYCRWAGKRLLTEAEWEKAARGTDRRQYPWGNDVPDEKLANFGKEFRRVYYDNRRKVVRERLMPVGSYEAGKSPYKVYDMAGNVREWVAGGYAPGYYKQISKDNPQGPDGRTKFSVSRGGSWQADSDQIRSASRRQGAAGGAINIGIRCAKGTE